MNSSGETKLLLILGLIVLFGGGALIGMNIMSSTPRTPQPTPPPVAWDAGKFDSIVNGARHIKEAPVADGAVTVIEFADFQCPSCRRAYAGNLGKSLKNPKRPIRLIFKNFPLENHEFAVPAAQAAEAAEKQGKFWEMYTALFEGVDVVMSEDFIISAAKKAGLNMDQFQKDWKSGEMKKRVEDDRKEAVALNIQYTPTFVVKDKNGKIEAVVGNDGFEDIMGAIFEGKPRKAPAGPPPGAMPMGGPPGAPGAMPPGGPPGAMPPNVGPPPNAGPPAGPPAGAAPAGP